MLSYQSRNNKYPELVNLDNSVRWASLLTYNKRIYYEKKLFSQDIHTAQTSKK